MKKMIGMAFGLIILYLMIWIAIYLDCKFFNWFHEPCIWNLKRYFFPFPKCVCVV